MITRGKLASATGCHFETIRYYERVGLLPKPTRTYSGYRVYKEEHVNFLNFIQRTKSLGFSTEQIRELLELSDNKSKRHHSDMKKISEAHIASVTGKIRDLQKFKRRLVEISSYCDGSDKSAGSCPILFSLFDENSKNAHKY